MSDTAKVLIDQALELPASERAVVAEQILLSLDKPDAELDAIWASEAESRLTAYKSDRESAVPLADALKTSRGGGKTPQTRPTRV